MRFLCWHGRRDGSGRATARALFSLLAALAALTIVLATAAQASYGADREAGGGATFSGLAPSIPSARMSAREAARKPARKGISLTPSSTEASWACPEEACEAIVDPTPATVTVKGKTRYKLPAGPLLEGGGELGGLDPQDLESAYKIPTSGGENQTVALVDAYGYPTAEEDLATYRARYDLPPCTKANGCFKKVNQQGLESNYPPPKEGWETESALDIEMVSAACPHCHIMLAEASSSNGTGLAETVNTAARLGATEISNSYGLAEQNCGDECEIEAADYDHQGVLVTASAGDGGYDNYERAGTSPSFPASLPTVVAVGGTALYKAPNARGWREQVWPDGGSGCTQLEPKPIWQTDSGCKTRMDDDVAAVGACETPLSTFSHGHKGWDDVCGTSASSPLVAGIEAHATEYARSLPGADAFYQDPEALFDVTQGSNGKCTPPAEHAYYCEAGPGYDGPTGNGTPDGPLELSGAPAPITVTSPASKVAGGEGTLEGKIDPEGLEASYHFEYGTTTAYGTSVPVPDASAGSGRLTVPVSETISGLAPNTVYHYRLVGTNANGTAYGADSAFSTDPPSVTEMTGATGPTNGDTSVTITGSNLDSAVAVRFGSHEAQTFTVNSEDSITAISPQGDGAVDVTVTTPSGTSEATPADRFVYDSVGPVLAWGRNSARLGDDDESFDSNVPVEVNELPEATDLAANYGDGFALMQNGTLEAWGSGGTELGDGEIFHGSDVPVHVCTTAEAICPEGDLLSEVSAVTAGDFDVLALMKNGTVYSWGDNSVGELADGSESELSLRPTVVCLKLRENPCKPEDQLKEVVAVAAGEFFSLALLRNGTVMAWGVNDEGELGTGKDSGPERCEEEEKVRVACSRVPLAVGQLSGVRALAAGGRHALALLSNGTAVGWGADVEGELGDGSTDQRDTPTAVCAAGELAPCHHDLGEIAALSAGSFTSMALLENGSVLDWGSNFNGELGDGSFSGPETCETETCSRSPIAVSGLKEASLIATGSQDTASMAVQDGAVLTWGGDKSGQLGDGQETASDVPVHVCQAVTFAPCPDGPYLVGEFNSIAVGGQHDVVSLKSSAATITAVTPNAGPGKGGTAVTITGNGLEGASAVHFGGAAAQEYQVRSNTEIKAVSPPGSGVVDVNVSTPGGTTHPTAADHFTYEAATVSGLDPSAGPAVGGTPVTITGTNLNGASAVHFGATEAHEFEVRSAGEIVAVSPAGSGIVDVTVTTPEGTSADTPADRFTYQSVPVVVTTAGTSVHLGSAVLNATVNPEGTNVSDCHFEYGSSDSYGTSVPCNSAAGSGSAPVPVLAPIAGLSAGSTYHFRIVATNADGTSYGADETLLTPATELPELGRCVKLATKTGGDFTNSGCTTAATGDSGKYEWEPGPGAKNDFKGTGGKVTVTITSQHATFLECTGSAITGSYTGPQSAVFHFTLSGCDGFFFGREECTSEDSPKGQITGTADAQLGVVTAAKKQLGWEWLPAGSSMASFTCLGGEFHLAGAVVGTVGKADKPSSSFALAFTVTKGQQVPEGFEGGVRAIPIVSAGTDDFPTTVAMSFTLGGEEPLELKAIA